MTANSTQAAPIFVSHSHEDTAWAHPFVEALRLAGADVWYDEHNLGYGILSDEIEIQLRARPIFIIILSPSAVRSRWVRREVDAAIRLRDRDEKRLILPVVAMTISTEVPIFWAGYRWISGPNNSALTPAEAARKIVHLLALAPPDAPTAPSPPAMDETAEEAYERGKGLEAQGRMQEALAAYERATGLKPSRAQYWNSEASVLSLMEYFEDALAAYDRALVLNPKYSDAWDGKIIALEYLGRANEAADARQVRDSILKARSDLWSD